MEHVNMSVAVSGEAKSNENAFLVELYDVRLRLLYKRFITVDANYHINWNRETKLCLQSKEKFFGQIKVYLM